MKTIWLDMVRSCSLDSTLSSRCRASGSRTVVEMVLALGIGLFLIAAHDIVALGFPDIAHVNITAVDRRAKKGPLER